MSQLHFADDTIDPTDVDGDTVDVDAADTAYEEGQGGEHDEQEERTGSGSSKPSARTNRVLIRRVANKAQEVVEADAVTRTVVSTLLGCTDSISDLTTAIMSAERGSAQPISDLYTIAEADAFEAATVAGALGRERMKAVWRLLGVLDAAPKGTMPASNPKAALDLAKHIIQVLDVAALRSDLDTVTALLRKN